MPLSQTSADHRSPGFGADTPSAGMPAHAAVVIFPLTERLKSRSMPPPMPSARPPEQLLLAPSLSAGNLLQAAVIPVSAISSLLLAPLAFDQSLRGRYPGLAVIVSLLTFPGRLPRGGTVRGVLGHA